MAGTALMAQPNFEQAMAGAVAQLDTAGPKEEWIGAVNRFERIAQAETDEWLPSYYAAYGHGILFYIEQDETKKEEHVKKAEEWLEKTKTVNGEHSEVLTLEAFIVGIRLGQDPMSLGATLGPKVGQLLGQAIKADPNNPRAYYLMGQNTYYTPTAYGGGAEKALPTLQKAVDLYEAEEDDPMMPRWGGDRAGQLLTKCQADLEK